MAIVSAPHPELLALRAEFPILERTTYLINNSLGAMPRAVHQEVETFARQWEERGVRAWHEGWWEMAVTTGDLLAPLLGVQPGSIAMHQNVAVAAAVFLSAIDYPAERNRIVYTGLNFPNVMYLLGRGAEEGGRDRHRPLGRRNRRPHRAAAGGDRRADPARAGLAHPLQERLRAGCEGDRRALPGGGGGPPPRRLPVDRGDAARPRGVGGARRHGRLGQVALRRPRRRLPLGPAGFRRDASSRR